jgi:hypothetical protein
MGVVSCRVIHSRREGVGFKTAEKSSKYYGACHAPSVADHNNSALLTKFISSRAPCHTSFTYSEFGVKFESAVSALSLEL